MIKLLIKAFKEVQNKNIYIVPVSMNHDRLFDIKFMSTETLKGTFQPELSPSAIAKVYMKMRRGKLGKTFVKFQEPINLNSYIQDYLSKHLPTPVETNQNQQTSHVLEDLSFSLTKELYRIQQEAQPITMNSLISAALLIHRHPTVKFKSIKQTCAYLYDYIQERQYKCYISTYPQYYDINEAALSLGFKVVGNPADKNKAD